MKNSEFLLIQRAIELHLGNNTTEALKLLKGQLSQGDKSSELYYYIAHFCECQRDYTAESYFLKSAVKRDPGNEIYWIRLIVALIRCKSFKTAQEVLSVCDNYCKSGKLLSIFKQQLSKFFSIKKSSAPSENKARKRKKNVMAAVKILIDKKEHKTAISTLIKDGSFFCCDSDFYHLWGAAELSLRNTAEAAVLFKLSLIIDSTAYPAWSNLGVTFAFEENYSRAVSCYRKSLAIRASQHQVWLNLGNVYKSLKKWDKAKEAYLECISVNKEYLSGYLNLSNLYRDIGNLEQAIEILKTGLNIKTDSSELWNNLGLLLPMLGSPDSLDNTIHELESKFGTNQESSLLKVNLIADDQEQAFSALFEGHSNTASAKKRFEQVLPSARNAYSSSIAEVICLINFGRSGTGVIHSLIDNHPEIATLPSIFFSEFFSNVVEKQFKGLGPGQISEKLLELYPILIDSRDPTPVLTHSGTTIKDFGNAEGLNFLGPSKNEWLMVDKERFQDKLNERLLRYPVTNQLEILFAINDTYQSIQREGCQFNKLFYHIHNPSISAKLNFMRYCPSAHWIMAIRSPVESWVSWSRRSYRDADLGAIMVRLVTMLRLCFDETLRNKRLTLVRLESLKSNPTNTLGQLSEELGISNDECLCEMTVMGKRWWGDPTSPSYLEHGMDPFDPKTISSSSSGFLSERDLLVISALFNPFNIFAGYPSIPMAEASRIIDDFLVSDNPFDFSKELRFASAISYEAIRMYMDYLKYYVRFLKPRILTSSDFYGSAVLI